MTGIVDGVHTQTSSFTYDPLDRLATATIRRMEAEAAFAAVNGLKYTAAQIRREIRQLYAKQEAAHEKRQA